MVDTKEFVERLRRNIVHRRRAVIGHRRWTSEEVELLEQIEVQVPELLSLFEDANRSLNERFEERDRG